MESEESVFERYVQNRHSGIGGRNDRTQDSSRWGTCHNRLRRVESAAHLAIFSRLCQDHLRIRSSKILFTFSPTWRIHRFVILGMQSNKAERHPHCQPAVHLQDAVQHFQAVHRRKAPETGTNHTLCAKTKEHLTFCFSYSFTVTRGSRSMTRFRRCACQIASAAWTTSLNAPDPC